MLAYLVLTRLRVYLRRLTALRLVEDGSRLAAKAQVQAVAVGGVDSLVQQPEVGVSRFQFRATLAAYRYQVLKALDEELAQVPGAIAVISGSDVTQLCTSGV
jgi:hypothetical protein